MVAPGLLNGFWNLLIDSKNGTVIKPTGTAAMDKTPNNLFGMTLNALKVGKKYHYGKISNGVANGSAGSPNAVGSITAKEMDNAMVPKITTGKMYNKSFGHAGSP